MAATIVFDHNLSNAWRVCAESACGIAPSCNVTAVRGEGAWNVPVRFPAADSWRDLGLPPISKSQDVSGWAVVVAAVFTLGFPLLLMCGC
jgi:hypothetical protein